MQRELIGSFPVTAVAGGVMGRAVLHRVDDDGSAWVTCAAVGGALRVCDVLATGPQPGAALMPGDDVLCWFSYRDEERGVLLGRIGSHKAGAGARVTEEDADAPDELVIEAKHSLVLRVGNGSITIREDGKILIKGKDLVSHAERVNRVRGGAVAIN